MSRSSVQLRRSLAILAILGMAFPSALAAVDLGKVHRLGEGFPVDLLARGDGYWLTWLRPEVSQAGLLVMRSLDPEGRPAGPVRRFFGGRTVAVQGDAALLAGVSQVSSDGWSGTIWVATLDTDGRRGPRRVIGDWSGSGLALVPWGDDGFALGFVDRGRSVHVQRLDLSGAPEGPPRLLADLPDPGRWFPRYPGRAISLSLTAVGDRLFAVWEVEGYWDPRHAFYRGPFGRFLDREGETGLTLRLSRRMDSDVPLLPVAAVVDGELVVAWRNSMGRVTLKPVDLASGAIGRARRVAAVAWNHDVGLAGDGAGGGLTTWTHRRRDELRLRGRWLDGGVPTGPPFRIGSGEWSRLAVGADGSAVVAWVEITLEGVPVLLSRHVSR